MDALDEILRSARTEAKTFHPVRERSEVAWFPGNKAAGLVIQIGHIWEDVSAISRIYKSQNDDYTKKLLLKYVIIEVRSLIEVFDQLQSLVMKTPTFDPKQKQGWREITVEEKDTARTLLQRYSDAKKQTSEKIIKIRNEICAHRENLDWQQVMAFWDAVTPDLVNPVLRAIPEAFDYVKGLDLYEWNRRCPNGCIEFIGAQLRPEYFDDINA